MEPDSADDDNMHMLLYSVRVDPIGKVGALHGLPGPFIFFGLTSDTPQFSFKVKILWIVTLAFIQSPKMPAESKRSAKSD